MLRRDPSRRRYLTILAVPCALCTPGLAFRAGTRNGPTYDELIHVTSGRAHLANADYRFQPENGWLPQRLFGLALLGEDHGFPNPDPQSRVWAQADSWEMARQWIFESGQDSTRLLSRARLVNALIGAALCWVVFSWSRSLFGDAGGMLSLTLAVFCPNLLAHSGLTTSDVCAAMGFTIALLAWWRLFHQISASRVAGAAAATAFLALSKFSVLLLLPMVAVLFALRLARPIPLRLRLLRHRLRSRHFRRIPALAGGSLIAGLLVIGLIWTAYGFRFEVAPARTYHPDLWRIALISRPETVGFPMAGEADAGDFTTIRPGLIQDAISLAKTLHALPEGWLYGLAHVARNSEARLAYFAGDYRLTGWPGFFPAAFALKTPPSASLALSASLILLFVSSGRRHRYRCAPLVVGLGVYGAAAIVTNLNIGYRHLLPMLPLGWVLCGALGPAFLRHARIGKVSLVLLAGGQIAAATQASPYYLAYFNAFAGGSAGGHRYLVDSSLDWGQGLPALDRWLAEHARGENLYLSYFGADEPRRLNRSFTRLADEFFDHEARVLPAPMRGGIYCIGATQYRRVYTRVRGPWSPRYEHAYLSLHAWFAQEDLSKDPHGGARLTKGQIRNRLIELEHLRFGRLLHFLGDSEPDAYPGNCVLVFRLSDEEVWAALDPARKPGP